MNIPGPSVGLPQAAGPRPPWRRHSAAAGAADRGGGSGERSSRPRICGAVVDIILDTYDIYYLAKASMY